MIGSIRQVPAPPVLRLGALQRATLAITAVCVIVLGAFGFCILEIRHDLLQRSESAFNLDARQRFSALETRLSVAGSVAETTGRFGPAFGGLNPIAFSGFLGGITGRYPWISAIEWVPKVDAAARGAFTEQASSFLPGYQIRDLGSDGTLRPASDRADYYPVTLVEPLGLAYQVAGLDLGGIPSLRQTLDAAGASGELRATGIIQSPRQGAGQPTALLIWPIYKDAPAGGMTADVWRRKNLRGFTVVLLNIPKLIVGAGDNPPEDALTITVSSTPAAAMAGFFISQPFNVGGRIWWVSATAPEQAYGPAPIVLWLGTAAASLVFLLVVFAGLTTRSVAKRSILIRGLHRDLAAAAAFSREILNTLREPVVIVDHAGIITASNRAWIEWRRGSSISDRPLRYLEAMSGGALAISKTHEIALTTALIVTLEGAEEDRECDIEVVSPQDPAQWYTVRFRAFDYLGQRQALIAHADISRLKIAEHELRQLAITDGLTQVANRRHFEERIREEAERCLRYGRPLVLLMLDVDYFKRINDTYGHPAGDAVLRRVAEICRQSTRGLDLVARYGGEEFAMLFPETDFAGAVQVAERIREEVEAMDLIYGDTTIRVTISGGLAMLGPGDADARQLIKDADSALYQAKQTGRNRVVSLD